VARSKKGRRYDNRRPFPLKVGAEPATSQSPGAETPTPVAREERTEPVWKRALWASAPAMLLAAVLLLPFADKAFTIDDTVFMRQAEWALTDPLHPSALTMVWSEQPRPMRLSQVMPTGPVMAWLLMPAAMAGGSEVVAHVVQVLLLVLAIFEVAALALRLGFDDSEAQLAALFLASTPAVLGMAGTAMPDVAAMTFGLLGIERLCAWRSGGGPAAGLLAAVALALAPLARSHLLVLPGIALFLLEWPWKPAARRQWLPVIAAAVLMLALVLLTRDPLGASSDMVKSAGLFSSLGNVRSNAIAFGLHWVLLLPLGLAWMLARGRRFWFSPLPWLGVAGSVAAMLYEKDSRWLWISPLPGLGIAVVADVVIDCVRRRDAGRIALALWLLIALPVVIYLHFPSKYLVACAPAAAILAASAVMALPRRSAYGLGGSLVAAGALLGTLILQADANFAGLGRRAVEELIVPRVAAGERVWFNANWGFQWYAERAGATILTDTPPRPSPGDLIVTSKVTVYAIGIRAFPRRELLATVSDSSPGGRVLSGELGAGFYSNGWGYLPWVWGSNEVDRFDLWRVR